MAFFHLFSELDLFEDVQPREGPFQMAVDEILLNVAERPLLRTYRWKNSWVSFGYGQKWREIDEAFPKRQLVRRWSGGGAVDHRRDWTFSLIVPASHPFRRLSVAASYYEIHSCLKATLSCFFNGISAVQKSQERYGNQCFVSPRINDLTYNGNKVAGGAQKRTSLGLLHQGSIQHLQLPSAFAWRFASYLGARINCFSPNKALWEAAGKISKVRYEAEEWLKRT
ncbi:MAG: hypothetical protein C5B47_07235 [Verrucomicrobia bacterium]|nr:MAG: hypothetical protein C5B47_07235 [Verrucomicrobiota bacterium]